MAILKGFPPSNTISPSVRITEKDLSFIAPDQSFHRAGIVGFASKGPINIPTMVASRRQLNTVFGYPHPESGDPYLIYAAEQYLLVATELYIVRVADTDAVSSESAKSASVEVTSSGGQVELVSDYNPGGTYRFSKAGYFKWRLNGVLASKTLVVLAEEDHPDAGVQASGYTIDQLIEDLNSQMVPDIDGIEFFKSGSTLGVRTTFSFGPEATLELVSVQDAIYGALPDDGGISTAVTGLGQGMTVASFTGSADRYPSSAGSAGNFDLTGIASCDLQIVIDGTDNNNIDNVIQVIDLGVHANDATVSAANVVATINSAISSGDVPGGFEAVAEGDNISLKTLHSGRDARILVKSESSLFEVFGFDAPNDSMGNPGDYVTAVGTSPEGVTGDADIEDMAIARGDSNTSGDVSVTFTADSAGVDGNATQVRVRNNIREGNFVVEVYNNGVQVESWGNLTKDETSRFYVETFLSLVSDYIRVEDMTDNPAPPADGVYSLSGGKDGIPSDPDDQDYLLIGNLLGMSGIYALSEPEQIDLDIVAVPGHSSTGVVLALIDMCQNLRMDCMAIIDPPFGLTVKEIVQWQNGAHPLNTTRFDSDFAALYWPWVKIRDSFNNVDVWVPPSGSVMAVYARNDFLAAPWFAPAGITRGAVPNITDVFSRPTLEERDLMYGNRNAINPIVQYIDAQDFVVWGQKTLQRKPTALDRVNVRRLMFVIEKRIRAASRVLLFEPHDEIFRQRFIQIATGILEQVQVGRGLTDFIIKADTELNTPDVIDRNEFRARIGVQPTRAVEFMFLEFSIHRTGSFDGVAESF